MSNPGARGRVQKFSQFVQYGTGISLLLDLIFRRAYPLFGLNQHSIGSLYGS